MTFANSGRLLGSWEAAFLALVRTTEATALLAAPDGCLATLGTGELHGAFARQYHASAPVAGWHSNCANFRQHRQQ